MPIAAGTRLGPYEVIAPIGSGAMGDVYRARDVRLGRDVAVKILPEAFAADPDRRMRFEREARTLASLNHPHIAQIYGFEEAGPMLGLAMELVDGLTLAERLGHGALPFDEAIAIARQIADGLEAAHEQGIVHRDLKPANIKVRDDGTVKILDFGLAKAFDAAASSSDAAMSSPTLTAHATAAGVILGTAAYMAPEQARGRPVDKRADIWAFGCIVYEMLTGRGPFHADTLTDVVAAVVTAEPDLTRVPERARTLVRRCLEKDLKQRLRDIGDAMTLLDALPIAVAAPAAAARRPAARYAALALAVAAIAATATAVFRFRPRPATQPRMRFDLMMAANSQLTAFALSPDGRFIVTRSIGVDGIARLALREVESGEERMLPGTERAGDAFWSSDSRSIAFTANGSLKRLSVEGGAAEVVASRGVGLRGCWGRDAFLVMNPAGGISRVPLGGGDPVAVTTVDQARGEIHHEQPACLPDGRFLYFRHLQEVGASGIYLGDPRRNPAEQPMKPLLVAADGPVLVPGAAANRIGLLFMQRDTLFVQPFLVDRAELVDRPAPVADHVASTFGSGYFSASSTGLLAYTEAQNLDRQLTWIDRGGKTVGTLGAASPTLRGLTISHDNRHAAVQMFPPGGLIYNDDLWIFPIGGEGSPLRFTSDAAVEAFPVWSPDDKRIAFASNRGGAWGIYEQAVDGSEAKRLCPVDNPPALVDWSSDGRFILIGFPRTREAANELWVLPVGAQNPSPVRIVKGPSVIGGAKFSPDGRWIAYLATDNGRTEVFVRRFEAAPGGAPASPDAGRLLVSNGARGVPRWRADGRELLYISSAGEVVSVDTSALPTLKSDGTRRLFSLPEHYARAITGGAGVLGDFTSDGTRLLAAIPTAASRPPALHVIVNWQ